MHDGLSLTGLRVKYYLDSLRFLIILAKDFMLLEWGRNSKLDHQKFVFLGNNLLILLRSIILLCSQFSLSSYLYFCLG